MDVALGRQIERTGRRPEPGHAHSPAGDVSTGGTGVVWSIDLADPYPIERFALHGESEASFLSHAGGLVVEASPDDERWGTIHDEAWDPDAEDSDASLTIHCGGKVLAQYIRVIWSGANDPALPRFEVFVRATSLALRSLCESRSFDYRRLLGHANPFDFLPGYRLEKTSAAAPDSLVGLAFEPAGRFGNNLLELSNAVVLAGALGLDYVRTSDFELYQPKEETLVEGVTVLPPAAPFPTEGQYLVGHFLYDDAFPGLLSNLSEVRRHDIVQKAVLPHLELDTPGAADPAELVVHIRSGDIFSDYIHPHYVQPPLAYYVLVTEKLLAETAIDKVCVVAEDRLNPCIDAFEAWLTERAIPFRMQNATLREDMAVIVNASHVVFGTGTFGYGACLLTKRFATVFTWDRRRYDSIGSIDRLFWIGDARGGYIRPGDWRNSDDQRLLMLHYPQENLFVHPLR